MRIKNQLILSPGINPNKVEYAKEGIDNMVLPKELPVFDHRQKLVGSAKNFVRKKHKIYCDIEGEQFAFKGMGAAIALMVKDVKQKGKHIVADGLDLMELSIVPNFFQKYNLNTPEDI